MIQNQIFIMSLINLIKFFVDVSLVIFIIFYGVNTFLNYEKIVITFNNFIKMINLIILKTIFVLFSI